MWRSNGIKTKHCGLSESIPKHDGAAGTDHYWRWNRIFVQSFDSALGKELKYSVENPGYHKIAKIYRSMGACYEYIEIEEDGPKVEELEEKEINVIHCSPSHHYPTGRVMPISKRYELLAG